MVYIFYKFHGKNVYLCFSETKPEQPSTTLPSSLPPAINPQVQAAILAAKAKIESQIPTTDLIGNNFTF